MSNKNYLKFLEVGCQLEEFATSAHWLKGDYHSNEWGIGSHKIHWNRGLPDGTLLTDLCNSLLLESARRIIFEVRNSPLCREMNDEHHYRRAQIVLCICDWMVQNSDRYAPRIYGFSALDSLGISEFVTLFAWGGPNEVSFIRDRLQLYFESIVLNTDTNDNTIRIPDYIYAQNTKNKIIKTFKDKDIILIRKWLYLNGYYEYNKRNINNSKICRTGMLNRKKIANMINAEKTNLTPRLNMYLRQFEFVDDYTKLEHIHRFKNCEYVPSNYLLTEEAADQPYSESRLLDVEATIAALSNLSETLECLPSNNVFNNINIKSIACQLNLRTIKHYRTTPVPIAIHVMKEAIRFI